MKRNSLIKILLLCVFTCHISARALYTMKDLNVLYEQKSFKEYLSHALDIRPSLRDKKWTSMTKEMANSYIDSLLKNEVVTKRSYLHIESLTEIPILRNDDFFQLKRTQYAYEFFKNCKITSCTKLFKDFWRTSKRNAEYDFKFYDLYRAQDPLIKKFILPHFTKSSGSEFYCKKGYVFKDIFKRLKEEVGTNTIAKTKTISLNFLDRECLQSISPKLIKKLSKYNIRVSEKLVAYKVLASNKLIKQDDEDYFFALYILQGPVVGEVFNLAWNRISKISQSYTRRTKLLNKLVNMDPLPGEIFAHPDKNKRDTIISFFNKNFPEYIDSYVKTCIKYYSGEGDFPLGNPTIHCDDLMKAAKKRSWIQDHLKLKYSGSKKI